MATGVDKGASDAEKQHQLETIETLKNLTKDYTVAAKETELQLKHEFTKRENDLLSRIGLLEQERDGYKSKATQLQNELVQSRSQSQNINIQDNEYIKQIQLLKKQLSQQKLDKDKLKREFRIQQQMNSSNEKLLAGKESEIMLLKEKLRLTAMSRMNNTHHPHSQSTVKLPTFNLSPDRSDEDQSMPEMSGPSKRSSITLSKPFIYTQPQTKSMMTFPVEDDLYDGTRLDVCYILLFCTLISQTQL